MPLSEYTFGYYNSDDGVWVKHGDDFAPSARKCQWEANLGFYGTVDDALRAVVAHEMESHAHCAE